MIISYTDIPQDQAIVTEGLKIARVVLENLETLQAYSIGADGRSLRAIQAYTVDNNGNIWVTTGKPYGWKSQYQKIPKI